MNNYCNKTFTVKNVKQIRSDLYRNFVIHGIGIMTTDITTSAVQAKCK